jgi:hypothetical protein
MSEILKSMEEHKLQFNHLPKKLEKAEEEIQNLKRVITLLGGGAIFVTFLINT